MLYAAVRRFKRMKRQSYTGFGVGIGIGIETLIVADSDSDTDPATDISDQTPWHCFCESE